MKKFLRLNLKNSEKEVPAELDAVILAAAAMRAKSNRKKRLTFKIAIPGAAAAGVAAAALLVALPAMTPQSPANVYPSEVRDIAQLPQPEKTVDEKKGVTTAELLALADTTFLEQESYNLATMADFSLDSDNFTM